jgi:hypothetical protein
MMRPRSTLVLQRLTELCHVYPALAELFYWSRIVAHPFLIVYQRNASCSRPSTGVISLGFHTPPTKLAARLSVQIHALTLEPSAAAGPLSLDAGSCDRSMAATKFAGWNMRQRHKKCGMRRLVFRFSPNPGHKRAKVP